MTYQSQSTSTPNEGSNLLSTWRENVTVECRLSSAGDLVMSDMVGLGPCTIAIGVKSLTDVHSST